MLSIRSIPVERVLYFDLERRPGLQPSYLMRTYMRRALLSRMGLEPYTPGPAGFLRVPASAGWGGRRGQPRTRARAGESTGRGGKGWCTRRGRRGSRRAPPPRAGLPRARAASGSARPGLIVLASRRSKMAAALEAPGL